MTSNLYAQDREKMLADAWAKCADELTALKAQVDAAFVMDCHIMPRTGDDPLFVNGFPRLKGYTILPNEDYAKLEREFAGEFVCSQCGLRNESAKQGDF